MEPWILLAGLGIQTLLMLGGGYGMVLRSGWSSVNLERQLASMQEELKKLSEVITAQAVHTTRLDNQGAQIAVIQREISDLRRGDGWIGGHRRAPGERGVDGEYK